MLCATVFYSKRLTNIVSNKDYLLFIFVKAENIECVASESEITPLYNQPLNPS
jgi:hypothetical protein